MIAFFIVIIVFIYVCLVKPFGDGMDYQKKREMAKKYGWETFSSRGRSFITSTGREGYESCGRLIDKKTRTVIYDKLATPIYRLQKSWDWACKVYQLPFRIIFVREEYSEDIWYYIEENKTGKAIKLVFTDKIGNVIGYEYAKRTDLCKYENANTIIDTITNKDNFILFGNLSEFNSIYPIEDLWRFPTEDYMELIQSAMNSDHNITREEINEKIRKAVKCAERNYQDMN